VGGVFGAVFFFAQWAVIAIGITLIGVFGPSRLRKIHIPLYLLLGWSGLLFVPQMLSNNIGLFYFIIGGGIIYSLGVIPFAIKKKCSHFIWHFFVLGGAVVQWIGIYSFIFV
jgi:hemolysin III